MHIIKSIFNHSLDAPNLPFPETPVIIVSSFPFGGQYDFAIYKF